MPVGKKQTGMEFNPNRPLVCYALTGSTRCVLDNFISVLEENFSVLDKNTKVAEKDKISGFIGRISHFHSDVFHKERMSSSPSS